MSSSSPYAPAAQLLNQIWTQHKSLKTLAYDKRGQLRCNKATYAQVCHVLENKRLLDTVLIKVPFSNVRNQGLLYVLLYELLLGPNRKIRGGGALKRQLLQQEQELQSALAQVQQQQEEQGVKTTVATFPRYVRINTLQADPSSVIQQLQSQYNKKELYIDSHVPNLLVLPPGNTTITQDKLVTLGKVILQDKSSCFSALCLIHGSSTLPFSGNVLDACAAPGNKTSHLAALLNEKNDVGSTTVYALDRSSTRLALLERRMKQLVNHNNHNTRVVTQHFDFLKTDPTQYPSVRGILLDPSCSGSGIFTSLDRLGENEDITTFNKKKRLEALSNFQLTALKHAMSFPQVTRIVYSTCSLHKDENEHVVSQALSLYNKEWKLVAPSCLQEWKRRGHVVSGLTHEQASCLIRADQEDETNGFFVAYLERTKQNEGNVMVESLSQHQEAVKVQPRRPMGIPVYNGQFSPCNGDAAAPRKKEVDPVALVSEPPSSTHSPTKADSSSTNKQDKHNKKVIGKKRAKRMAWKRKQMEQKLRRLEKKQSSNTTKEEEKED